jgi:hypothetical protein
MEGNTGVKVRLRDGPARATRLPDHVIHLAGEDARRLHVVAEDGLRHDRTRRVQVADVAPRAVEIKVLGKVAIPPQRHRRLDLRFAPCRYTFVRLAGLRGRASTAEVPSEGVVTVQVRSTGRAVRVEGPVFPEADARAGGFSQRRRGLDTVQYNTIQYNTKTKTKTTQQKTYIHNRQTDRQKAKRPRQSDTKFKQGKF